MAIDIQGLVEIHIRPVLVLDTLLHDDIPTLIMAQTAQQGWAGQSLSDPQCNYIAALTLEALMPRLSLIFTMEVQEVREGPQNVRLPNRAEFMRNLQKAVDTLKATAGYGVDATVGLTSAELAANAWPGCGIAKWK